jgi:hypothetical protein
MSGVRQSQDAEAKITHRYSSPLRPRVEVPDPSGVSGRRVIPEKKRRRVRQVSTIFSQGNKLRRMRDIVKSRGAIVFHNARGCIQPFNEIGGVVKNNAGPVDVLFCADMPVIVLQRQFRRNLGYDVLTIHKPEYPVRFLKYCPYKPVVSSAR